MKAGIFCLPIVMLFLSACGGGSSSNSSETAPVSPVVPKTTQIDNIELDSELVRTQESSVVIECANCLKQDAIYRWEIDGEVVSDSISFTPDFAHLDKTVSVFAQVPSTDGVLSEAVTISKEIVSRKTTITDIRFDSTFIREQQTKVLFECENCLKEQANFSWVMDNAEVGVTDSFIPDFEHLDKTITVTVQVPSVDNILSEPEGIDGDIVSRKTKIDRVEFIEPHMPGQLAEAAFSCEDCLPETISMEWFIDGVSVAEGTSFTPNVENYDKRITIQAQVTSVDRIVSEVFTGDFIKPVPVSGYATVTETFILMSNGELIFDSQAQRGRLEQDKQDFVNVHYDKWVWGALLAEDAQGNFYRYGDSRNFYNAERVTSFEEAKGQIDNVQYFWMDGYGEHVLTEDGRIITWDNTHDDSGNFDFSKPQLSQSELTNCQTSTSRAL